MDHFPESNVDLEKNEKRSIDHIVVFPLLDYILL
jgi:hypothetical protein